MKSEMKSGAGQNCSFLCGEWKRVVAGGMTIESFQPKLIEPVRPKNSAEVRWRIEPQGLLKDSPLCDDATPIPAHRGRRLDEPTPAGCHRIPPGRKSHPAGTTRWQTQALHRRPAHSASAQSQTRQPTPPGEISHPRHSRYPPLVPCPGRQKVDLSRDQSPRSTIRCRNELGGMLNYYYREAA